MTIATEGLSPEQAALVAANRGLAAAIAARCHGRLRALDLDDLIQEGHVGLIGAARSYDASTGVSFGTYATYWVRGAIGRAIARASRVRERAAGLNLGVHARSRSRPPGLLPLFPIVSYTPRSACPHHGPIEPGSLLCCMVCHRSGMDEHPAMRRDLRTEPAPDRKPAAPVSAPGRTGLGARLETRRERRRWRFAGTDTDTGRAAP
jgi:RNA polymerase sigma factor (sigma-70 family)